MVRRSMLAILALAGVALAILLVPSGEVVSQAVREVFVTNFPGVQRIEGAVSVVGPVRLAQTVRFEDVTVAPVGREDTMRLVEVGTLVTEGFPGAG